MATEATKPIGKRKLGCWGTFLVILAFSAVVSTINVVVNPDRERGAVPPPIEGASIHWYEPKNSNYVLEERRKITKVEPGYVTMTRPTGESLRVPREKYDGFARR